MEKKTTYGLRLDQMAGLFAMGAGDPDPAAERGDDETLRDLLHEQLTCAEPRGSLLRETLVMMIDRAAGATGVLAGRTLGEALLDPQSDLDLLGAITWRKPCISRPSPLPWCITKRRSRNIPAKRWPNRWPN